MGTPTTYQSGQGSSAVTINAWETLPTGTPNGGLVILAYGSDGYVDNENGEWKTMIDKYADELASRQFMAVVPNYFDKTGTSPGDLNVFNPNEYREQVTRNRDPWKEAIGDAIVHFTDPARYPAIDRSRVGLVGFSLGGHLSARLAAECKCLSIYFAPYAGGFGLSGRLDSLSVEIHHGEADELLDYNTNAVGAKRELEGLGASVELWPAYPGANHGFTGSDDDNKKARDSSMKETLKFFAGKL